MRRTLPIKNRLLVASAKLALAAFVSVAVIAALEACLRLTHAFGARTSWSEPDELIGYRYTPGSRYWVLRENDHAITGTINSFGWRDIEWSIEKPDGVVRVAVLGDSYVEAFQIESSATFLSLAENELNDSSTAQFEVMNFGRSGFTQTEEVVVLQHDVLQFSPDLVILFFLPANDIADVRRETAHGAARPFFEIDSEGGLTLDTSFTTTTNFKMKRRINWYKQHSALVSLAAERYVEFNIRRRMRNRAQELRHQRGVNTLSGYLSLCSNRPDSRFLASYELNKTLISRMNDICAEYGIGFSLVCIDDAYTTDTEDYCRRVDPSFNPGYFEDDLRSFAASIGSSFIGLQSIFKEHHETTGALLHFGKWDPDLDRIQTGHWNYEGHMIVADALAKHLRAIAIPDIADQSERNPHQRIQTR